MSNQTQIASYVTTLLVAVLLTPLFAADNQVITDFTNQTDDLQWVIQNDNVMGGRSLGGFETEPDHLYFTGSTNTTGGGFSSILSKPLDLDLSSHNGIELKLQGDGRRYTWSLQTDATLRGRKISYWADFKTEATETITVKIPFTDFQPRFRGTKLDGPPIALERIAEMGLFIYDGNDGPFSVRLYSVGTY